MDHDPVPREKKLVGRACKGDQKALSTLYRRHLDDVYRYIYGKVGTRADAEDLTSQVFLKMVENLEHYREEGPFVCWLLGIARYTVLDFWRQQYQIQELPLEQFLGRFPTESATSPASDQGKHLWVTRLLNALPDNYRQVLELRFLKGYSVRETTQAMEISENYTKVLQHRALKKARELEEQWKARDDERR